MAVTVFMEIPYALTYGQSSPANVWRVLNGRRDIPACMQEPPGPPDD